jgi:predicted regulator of Ras-like GTPase activity (Roadblock/LC7/MglB family)
LSALSEQWPEGLRLEIIQSNLAHAQVLLPINLIEPALKRGRITFTWRNLRPLIKPTPPAASIHDGIELELPLSVVAPLFITRQKATARTQPAARPPAEIPNLFFGFPQPEPSQPQPPAKAPVPHPFQPQPVQFTPPEPPPVEPQPVEPETPETPPRRPQPVRPKAPEPKLHRPAPEPQSIRPLPDPRPALRPTLKPADAKLVDSNYYVWANDSEPAQVDETEYRHSQRPATDFTSRYATPKEIVERAMELPGVAGVLLALPDGLLVASQIPPEYNADTLAAFLPQIFDRVSQSTKELRMGALNNFNFTVGNVPWRIFRVNAVYFAAFGCAGEALPSAQLAALAAELDRKKS